LLCNIHLEILVCIDRNCNVENKKIFTCLKQEEGLYSLFYHNCYNSDYRDLVTKSNFAIYVVEKNQGSYLSAGEIPLPAVFLSLALLFLLSAIFWTFILRRNGTELVIDDLLDE